MVRRWARCGVLVPSVYSPLVKVWSYPDLMGLRIVYWLTQKESGFTGAVVPRDVGPAVRAALRQLAEIDLGPWSDDRVPAVVVDRRGEVTIRIETDVEQAEIEGRRDADDEFLCVTAPFSIADDRGGPHLNVPRPGLRITPGRLGGAPHIAHTRVETQALAALALTGLSIAKIYTLYPSVLPAAIDDALDLERQLQENLNWLAA